MKNHNCLKPLILLLLSLSLNAAPAQTSSTSLSSTSDSPSHWAFDVVPYLWLAGYDGTFGLPDMPARQSETQSTDSFTTHIAAVAMLTAQVHYDNFGLYLDGAWLQLKTEGDTASSGYSGTEIRSDIAYGTGAFSYRLPPLGRLTSDLYAGARVWYVSNDIELEPGTAPGFTASNSRTWADPIIGANLRYAFSRHWFGTVLGDFGGFGAGSDFTWSVFGGVGYSFTDWFSATLGYRYLHVDYEKDQFLMDANIQGFLLGLGFHF